MANARPFRALKKLSDEERSHALGRIEAGIHPQDVANQFNVHRSTIIRLRDRHRATGTVSDRPKWLGSVPENQLKSLSFPNVTGL